LAVYIAIFISILREAQERKQRLGIICANEHYRRVLQIIGLDQHVPVYASEKEGLTAIEQ
jgi:anti-anti-sigma regulatory factor